MYHVFSDRRSVVAVYHPLLRCAAPRGRGEADSSGAQRLLNDARQSAFCPVEASRPKVSRKSARILTRAASRRTYRKPERPSPPGPRQPRHDTRGEPRKRIKSTRPPAHADKQLAKHSARATNHSLQRGPRAV